MGKLLLLSLAVVGFAFPAVADACSGSGDTYHLCMAKKMHDDMHCSRVKNGDLNKYCWAVLRGSPGQCSFIKSGGIKQKCLAEAKANQRRR